MSAERRRHIVARVMIAVVVVMLVLFGAVDQVKTLRAVPAVSSCVSKARSAVPFQMVVPLLHDGAQNWKQSNGEMGDFMLDRSVEDIPIEVMSMDRLYDPNEITSMFRPELVYSHLLNRTGKIEFVPLVNGNKAQECPAYLTHILRNYHNLPDVSIFVHANPLVHGNPHILQDIRYIVHHWTPDEIGFLHLNHYPICRPGIPLADDRDWMTAWALLGFKVDAMPSYIQSQCCAQFMVTRERILLRPRWFYEQLLKFTYQVQKCAFQEHYWHLFFGEGPFVPIERTIAYYRTRGDRGDVIGEWKPPRKAVLTHPYPNVPYSDSMKVWYEKSVQDPMYYTNMTRLKC